MKKKKILFCHTGLSSFVNCDLEILSNEYEVISYHYKLRTTSMMKIANLFSSFFFALKWIWKIDVVYVWFAGYHGFFPIFFAKLFKKKSIIIVGGYDASYVPSISYGVFFNNGFQLWCVTKMYNWVTWICPVDESLVESTNYYADPSGVGYKTGILNFMPYLKSKIVVIPTGYLPSVNLPGDVVKSGVLCVAIIENERDYFLKGFDVMIEIAKLLEDFNFTMVGVAPNYYKLIASKIPKNIDVVFQLKYDILVKVYQKHKAYIQISMSEGLPNSLCEAMLYECIPIGSNVGGIPKAIGNSGFILHEKKPEELTNLIHQAIEMDEQQGQRASERILKEFPLERRVNLLLNIINS